MSDDSGAPARALFQRGRSRGLALAQQFTDDPEAAMVAAEARLESMLPGLAYLDDPRHPMASSLFLCMSALALYLVLREQGVDAHSYGRAFVDQLAASPPPPPPQQEDDRSPMDRFAGFLEKAQESQVSAKPGEFVFEARYEGSDDLTWSMNVKSCAICHAFAQHDAMDLVPYMCATDDVVSDQLGQGLRRTGTIALGAHQCDFRYRNGGEPLKVADQYPDRIRLAERG